MIVIVFIKDKIETGPTRREESVVTLFMRHVHQLVDLPPIVPLKAAVKLRISFERGIFVDKRAIRNSRATSSTQRHVVISLVSFGGIVVEIERGKRFAEHAGKFGDVFVERRHRIEPANRHLTHAVVIVIEESKRVFPVESW